MLRRTDFLLSLPALVALPPLVMVMTWLASFAGDVFAHARGSAWFEVRDPPFGYAVSGLLGALLPALVIAILMLRVVSERIRNAILLRSRLMHGTGPTGMLVKLGLPLLAAAVLAAVLVAGRYNRADADGLARSLTLQFGETRRPWAEVVSAELIEHNNVAAVRVRFTDDTSWRMTRGGFGPPPEGWEAIAAIINTHAGGEGGLTRP